MTKFFTALLFVFAALASPAMAQTFPEFTGDTSVIDQADLLSPAEEAAIDVQTKALFEATGRPLVVVTIADLEGYEIEDYGYRLGREWGIGDAETDDGTLFIIAPNERRMRIETGYGARVFLPDVLSGRIIRNTVTPYFKDGDFPGGIAAGVSEISTYLAQSPEEAQARADELASQPAPRTTAATGESVGAGAFLIFMIVMFVVLSISRRSGGRRYQSRGGKKGNRRRRKGMDSGDLAVLLWGIDAATRIATRGGGGFGGGFGGGGGGGFGGFSGGGGFGGGGASGGW